MSDRRLDHERGTGMTSIATIERGSAHPVLAEPSGIRRAFDDIVVRALSAVGVTGIAVIHVLDAQDTYHHTRYIFWLYVAIVVAAVPTVALLLHWRSGRVWLAPAALAVGPFVGYLWSRTIGLPGDTDDIGDWLNTLGLASLLVEAIVISVSLSRLRLHVRSARRARS
jgi:Na+/proline symporter